MRGGRIGLSVVLVGAMMASTIHLFAMAVLAVDLIDELALSRTQIGLLATANSLVGAALAPRLGLATDRLGPRRSIVVILALSAASLLVTSLASTFIVLVLGSIIGGGAQGWSNPATNKLIAVHVRTEEQGVITGIKQSGVQVAGFVAGLTLPTAALTIGWRWGIAAYAAASAALAAATPLLVPPDPDRRAAESADRSAEPVTAAAGLRGPVAPIVWRTTIYAFLLGLVGGAIGRFLPLFVHESLGYSTRLAGFVAALAGLVGIVARIAWGRLSDRGYPARPALAMMAGLAAVACLVLAGATEATVWLVWPVAVLLGFGSNAWNTVANLAIIRGVPLADAGRSSGIMLLGFLFGISVGTPVAGLVIDATETYTLTWLGCGVLSLLGLAVAYERRSRAEPAFAR